MDAQISRDRCLQAMGSTDDLETKRSLWKAALKYQQRVRSEASAADWSVAGSPLAAQAWGSVGGGRECL